LYTLTRVPWVVPALVQWGINVLALIVADWVFSGISIGRWGSLLLAGAVLGLANVFLKPLLTFIALPLILLTFGIAYFFVNVVMLLFTEWVVPDFSIDGFWTYVGATIVIWLVNWLVSQVVWSVSDNRP
jgi:putative membrane protein